MLKKLLLEIIKHAAACRIAGPEIDRVCVAATASRHGMKNGKRPGRPQKLLSPHARGHRTRSTILSADWLAQQKKRAASG